MYLSEEERGMHSELYDQIQLEKSNRREYLRDELRTIRRSATQARTWRYLFWVVIAGAVVAASKLVGAPRQDMVALLALGMIGYATVADKLSVLQLDLEEANFRLHQWTDVSDDVLYKLAILDETITRVERYMRTRGHA